MNKIYVIFVMFAISGLLFANVPIPSHAAVNLDYMLTIAEKAKTWCKSEIEARESVDQKILDLYLQSISEVDKLFERSFCVINAKNERDKLDVQPT